MWKNGENFIFGNTGIILAKIFFWFKKVGGYKCLVNQVLLQALQTLQEAAKEEKSHHQGKQGFWPCILVFFCAGFSRTIDFF
ncbi:MAG: hypothetical protein Q7K34_03595 [archaeon]|nr:hypothetical protein [archaeon]